MPYASNTFILESDSIPDKAKHNTGGLSRSGTLIEQGDNPVNVIDLERYDKMDLEMRELYPDMYAGDSDYMQPKRCGGDIEEGVSMCRPMFNDTVRKNSDY